MCVVFAVGTDLWKKRAAEKEREAGVLLFEEERGVGVTGWGRERSMYGRAPLLPCERRGYCPGNLSERLPWGPLPLALPHPLSYPPPPHSLFLLNRFSTCSGLPNRNCSLSRLSHKLFFTQTHISFSLSALWFWPPSRRGLNSMHCVISLGCVHTAVRCGITMPWRDGSLTDLYLIRLLQQQCMSEAWWHICSEVQVSCRRQFVCRFHF